MLEKEAAKKKHLNESTHGIAVRSIVLDVRHLQRVQSNPKDKELRVGIPRHRHVFRGVSRVTA